MEIADLIQEHPEAYELMKSFKQFSKLRTYKPKAEFCINQSEFQVLLSLKSECCKVNTPMKISELVHKLEISNPTITPLLESLEEKGFICKVKDTVDKRITRISLSKKGSNLLHKSFLQLIDDFESLSKYLGKEETIQLAHTLMRVCDFLKNTSSYKNKTQSEHKNDCLK